MNKTGLAALLCGCLLGLGGYSTALASTYKSSQTADDVTVDKTTDSHTIYASGNTVTLDTEAPSDFFAVAGSIAVRKSVQGSVFGTASTILVSAPVAHSLRLAGGQVDVNGDVGEDVSVVGANLSIHRDTTIHGDIHFVGNSLTVNGHVTGSITATASTITINGTVDGNITVAAEHVAIPDTASVGGSLHYRSRNDAVIAPGVVKGSMTKSMTESPGKAFGVLMGILSMLVSGFVVLLLARHKVERLVHRRGSLPFQNFALGLAVTFLFPISIIILLVSVIGTPLALVLASLYVMFLYIAAVMASIFVGTLCVDLLKLKTTEHMRVFVGLLLGVLILSLMGAIPYIGGAMVFLLTMYVLGLMVRYDIDLWHKLRQQKDL